MRLRVIAQWEPGCLSFRHLYPLCVDQVDVDLEDDPGYWQVDEALYARLAPIQDIFARTSTYETL